MSQEQRGMFCHTKVVVRIEHVQFADDPIDWVDVADFIRAMLYKGLGKRRDIKRRYIHDIHISDYEESNDSTGTT